MPETTESRILDRHGNPIRRRQLTREIAAPSLTGLRQIWSGSTVAGGLTPERLAGLLLAADDGDSHDYLTLAEEMEERDPHYASVLGTRKRAVSGVPVTVEAYSDAPHDVALADAVRRVVRRPAFGDLVDDLLDALGKGYSAVELLWRRDGSQWLPDYAWRDPRFFVWYRASGHSLRLLDEADPNGVELPPYKFIIHTPRLKSGLPARGGLARLAAFSYMCKAWTVKDWLAFADVFGLPLRVGKYGPNATEEEKAVLLSAVANIASDAAGIIPESMNIEFQTVAATAGGPDMFLKLAEWLDKQISKAVLGQTMTADDGSSNAQAQVHNDVRVDILEADAKALANTLNRDLLRPYIDLNFGPQADYPRIELEVPKPEDLALLADGLAKLVPLGLQVEQSVIRDKMGLPDPDQGAALLTPPGQAAAPASADGVAALNRATPATPELVDHYVDQLQDQTAPAIGQMLDQIKALLGQAESLEAFQVSLLDAYGHLDPDALAQVMQLGFSAADLAGRYEVENGR